MDDLSNRPALDTSSLEKNIKSALSLQIQQEAILRYLFF